MRNDIKKPLLSSTLVGGDNKGLQSALADQHRDRITRFGIFETQIEATRKLFVDTGKIQRKLSNRPSK